MYNFLAIGPWQILIVVLLLFIGILPTILALIDIVKNEFTRQNKIVWVLIVLFGNFVGAILYFLIGRYQKIESSNKA